MRLFETFLQSVPRYVRLCILCGIGLWGTVGQSAAVPTHIIGLNAEPQPQSRPLSAASSWLFQQLYTGLVKQEQQTVAAGLASHWRSDRLFQIWTVRIRPQQVFSNGVAISNQAVLWNILRWNNRLRAAQLEPIIQSASITDAGQIVIRLRRPYRAFPALLSHPLLGIMLPSSLSYGQSVGSGPYLIQRWQIGKNLSLQPNPYFSPKAPEINVRWIADGDKRFDALKNGELFSAQSLPPLRLHSLKTQVLASPFTVQYGPYQSSCILALNLNNTYLKDLNIRRALNFGINRSELSNSLWKASGRSSPSLLPEAWGTLPQLSNQRLPYHLDDAQTLLQQAGFANGLELTLGYPSQPEAGLPYPKSTAEQLAADLSALGIKIVFQPDPSNPPDLYLRGLSPLYPDPDAIYSQIFSQKLRLDFGYQDSQLNYLLSLSQKSYAPLHIYSKIEALNLKNVWVLPLIQSRSGQLIRKQSPAN